MNRLLPTRRLIPRWRKSRFSLQQPDLLGLVKPVKRELPLEVSTDEFERTLAAWKASGSVGHLADLLAFGLDSRYREALTGVAEAALALDFTTPSLRLAAQEVLGSGASQDELWKNSASARDIKGLRSLLRNSPNDVIALVDLAQHHLAYGKRRSAYRALAMAHQLSPDSVLVCRAVARYWIHVGDAERAHSFLKRLPRVSVDPWLMASEIATAQVVRATSTQLRRAQRALNTGAHSVRDVSELAGAVAGFELTHGGFKEARKLFRMALEHPNDNVLAQAITNQDHLGIEIDEQVIRRAPNGVFEGRALRAMLQADFVAAASLTACWGEEEPFSSRPRTLQSFVCGALGNYEESLDAANRGLAADPDDLSLRGNRAYGLAALGRLDEAESELSVLQSRGDENQRPFTLATRGMVLLLRGQHIEGTRLYEEALEEFARKKQEAQYTDCLAFMARAVAASQTADGDLVTKRATERFEKVPSPAAAVVLRTLNQSVREIEATPLRKVVQWEWEPESNTLVERRQLTRKGAPGFIVTGSANKEK